MPRQIKFDAQLRRLKEALKELESVRDELPTGAHMWGLVQLAIAVTEDQIASQEGLRLVENERVPPFDAAA